MSEEIVFECPKCRSDSRIEVAGHTTFVIYPDGEIDDYQGAEYEDDSHTRCRGCGYTGVLSEFRKPEVVELEYSHFGVKALKAERKGLNALILWDTDGSDFELEHRWLSQEDDELACVQGSEISCWPKSEVQLDKLLFDQFNLF